MTDIKQDLQRKICSYQSILKKTYAAAEKEKVAKKTKAKGSREREHSSKAQSMLSTQKKRAQGTGASTSYTETGCQPSKLASRQLYQPAAFR